MPHGKDDERSRASVQRSSLLSDPAQPQSADRGSSRLPREINMMVERMKGVTRVYFNIPDLEDEDRACKCRISKSRLSAFTLDTKKKNWVSIQLFRDPEHWSMIRKRPLDIFFEK